MVCDADLSKSTMTTYFAKEFPDRFFACGIAEANMVAIGAGLASAGKIPFVSSFSAFVLNKGFEQLRVTAAYPNVNLKVVGTHSGISIGEDGPSQMSIEDLGLACSLPGFTVISPADEVATRWAVALRPPSTTAASSSAPAASRCRSSIRLTPEVRNRQGGRAGRRHRRHAHRHRPAGGRSHRAAEQLDAEGISARVIDMHTIKPLDDEAIAKAARKPARSSSPKSTWSMAASACAWPRLSRNTHPAPVEFVGLTGYAESASPDELLDKYGMRAPNIVAAARRVLAGNIITN